MVVFFLHLLKTPCTLQIGINHPFWFISSFLRLIEYQSSLSQSRSAFINANSTCSYSNRWKPWSKSSIFIQLHHRPNCITFHVIFQFISYSPNVCCHIITNPSHCFHHAAIYKYLCHLNRITHISTRKASKKFKRYDDDKLCIFFCWSAERDLCKWT